jgi:oligosaccharide repeat unit polymerase
MTDQKRIKGEQEQRGAQPFSGAYMPSERAVQGNSAHLEATTTATTLLLCGLALTWTALPDDNAVTIFTTAAVGVGLSLLIATGVEVAGGLRNMIRVDVLMLWALYGLTFLEYLFPQADENMVTITAAVDGTTAVLLGFAGIAIGRHLVPWRSSFKAASFEDVPPHSMFLLFMLAASLGYLHIFIAVNFDPLEMLHQMVLPRFEQSWARGRYGDLWALLAEVGALIYVIPPIAGLMFARASEFSFLQKFTVAIVALLTFFYGFASGTRSALAVYAITFFGAYILYKRELKIWLVCLQGLAVVLLLLIASVFMLDFRQFGLSNFSSEEAAFDTVYIDRNLPVISELTIAFPNTYDYLGLEIPFYALIHPIPRAFWPGKPEALSVTVESIVGTGQATIATTFVGEGYMSAGMLGVILAGILFGAAAEMWNRVGRDSASAFSLLLYASGFFCAITSMRSLLWTSVTVLPTIALWLYGKLFLSR